MALADDLSKFARIANGAFNSIGANSTAITSINVGGAAVNSTSFPGTANNSTNFGGLSLATVQSQITGNAATSFTNATTFASNATNITTGTLPDARLSGAVVNTSGSFTLSGNTTFNANVTVATTGELIIANGAGVQANGSFGSAGQVLTSNSTGVYWSTVAGVNTAAQYSWSNTQSFSANVSMTGWLDIESFVETDATPTISGGTLTLDLAAAQVFEVSLNANITTLTINNIPATASKVVSFTLVLTADGTARSVVWPAAFRWPANTAPTITSTLNRRDVFVFFTADSGTSWNAFVSGQNL
jgi:hypothetical protein